MAEENVFVFDAKANLEELIYDRTEAYALTEDEAGKEKILKEILQLQAAHTAICENENAAKKTEIEAQLKERMNKLDNETKLAQARIERNMKWLQFGCDIAKAGANVGMEIHRINVYSANLGDARRFDAGGYSTINSTSSRMANQLAMKEFGKDMKI